VNTKARESKAPGLAAFWGPAPFDVQRAASASTEPSARCGPSTIETATARFLGELEITNEPDRRRENAT